MINSNVFNYINVLDKTADAAWIRQETLSNNIANATTPGYKRQDINFEGELLRALGNRRFEPMDTKVANLKINRLNPRTYTDYDGFSYRLDGNNVDIDTENVMLASNQVKYNAIMTGVNQEFANLKTVMK
ncbi:MAG: flagellar basal body rod protein FlgB [Lachnospiraceae bacterium]|jgi:flagellar basal-body rod protein FlgB|nr:flagellar basal body rod protein FlgB [Lachnospiraceae bacterium]